MTTPPGNPAPGWYPDPAGGGGHRYWDGLNWTEAAPPSSAPAGFPAAGSVQPRAAVSPEKAGMSNGKKVALLVGGTVVAIGVIGSIGGGGEKDKEKPAASSSSGLGGGSTYSPTITQAAPTTPKTREAAAAGSSVRDGKFEFQVLGVTRGATSMDDAFGPEIAKGEFYTVKVRVTNVGDDARSFSATNQKLIINGNEYEATSFMDNSWLEKINPGLGIDGQVTFDIPKGAQPQTIEFHDSMFSGGALVALPAAG